MIRSIKEIEEMIKAPNRVMEQALDIKIRNGQAREGIQKALKWSLDNSQ